MSGAIWVAITAQAGAGGDAPRASVATWELFAAAGILAEGSGTSVAALVLGALDAADLARVRSLAGEVVQVEGGALAAGASRAYAASAAAALSGREPRAVLATAESAGREWAPRLAVRLGGSPLTEISEVAVEGGELRFGRPVFGGKAVATLAGADGPCIVTVKPGAFEAPVTGAGAAASVETVAAPEVPRDVTVVAHEEAKVEGVPLNAAPAVVSGGRGLGGPAPFQNELKQLADLLGGAVGASLAAVDAGWVPQTMQVGQTGTAVSPTVYIAIGISGASQHLAGISGARHVVAINKDKDAPIFRVAELGLVGDYQALLPEILKAVQG